jgi:5'-nucleotidase (lipoprotein e(P4) family)
LLTLAALALVTHAGPLAAQQATTGHDVKYVRDSEEYAALTRQVYRLAGAAVERAAAAHQGRDWVVVLDVDETVLDNSEYELLRRAYGYPFGAATWAVWTARRAAVAVPGVSEFLASVRRQGGRVAFVTNRNEPTRDDTRANMMALGLWSDADVLCLETDSTYTKAVRRAEISEGRGRCSFGRPVSVVAYVGDQMGDFPRAGERDPDAGSDAAFGVRYFLLPNPMYGAWTSRVTRVPR